MKTQIQMRTFYSQIVGMAIGFFLALLCLFLLSKAGLYPLYNLFIFFCVGALLFKYKKDGNKVLKKKIPHIVLGIAGFLFINLMYNLWLSYLHIPVWDFFGFYLFSHIGILKLNFYDPTVFMQVFQDLQLRPYVDDSFISEIVNVGFWYPPPSMFLFLPLGYFDISTSYKIWQTIIICFLLIDIFLIYRYLNKFTSSYSNLGSSLLIVFILLFPNLLSPILFSQTLSIFLFFLILLIQNIDNWKSGMFLSILIIIKPFAVIFLLYFLLFKKWKIVRSFVLSGCLIILISLYAFGYHSFFNFFHSPPTDRIPVEILYEQVNQSLHAAIMKIYLKIFGYLNLSIINIVTYLCLTLLTVITLFSSYFLSKKSKLLSFLIFIPFALLIYPNTLISYIIVLVPVILFLYIENPFNNKAFNFLFLFFLYAIGEYSFLILNLVLWTSLLFLSIPPQYHLIEKLHLERFNFPGKFRPKMKSTFST